MGPRCWYDFTYYPDVALHEIEFDTLLDLDRPITPTTLFSNLKLVSKRNMKIGITPVL